MTTFVGRRGKHESQCSAGSQDCIETLPVHIETAEEIIHFIEFLASSFNPRPGPVESEKKSWNHWSGRSVRTEGDRSKNRSLRQKTGTWTSRDRLPRENGPIGAGNKVNDVNRERDETPWGNGALFFEWVWNSRFPQRFCLPMNSRTFFFGILPKSNDESGDFHFIQIFEYLGYYSGESHLRMGAMYILDIMF
jgi:hypothetical protein